MPLFLSRVPLWGRIAHSKIVQFAGDALAAIPVLVVSIYPVFPAAGIYAEKQSPGSSIVLSWLPMADAAGARIAGIFCRWGNAGSDGLSGLRAQIAT